MAYIIVARIHISMMERTFLDGNVSRPLRSLWSLGMSAVAKVEDESAVPIPSVAYSFAENVGLLLNGAVYMGQEGSERPTRLM